MNNIMVDLETLGTKPTSVFLSIGAIQFNINTGEIGNKFYATVDLKSSMAANLTIDADTLKWWLKQDESIRNKMLAGTTPLVKVLDQFSNFLDDCEIASGLEPKLWGNSAAFDLGILGNAFDAINAPRPWKHTQERDYRTINSEFYDIGEGIERKDLHDPIADCEYQIKKLCKIWKVINHMPHEKEFSYRAVELLKEVQNNNSPAISNLNEKIKAFLNPPENNRGYSFENPLYNDEQLCQHCSGEGCDSCSNSGIVKVNNI